MGGGNIHTKNRIWTAWVQDRCFRVEVGTTFVGVVELAHGSVITETAVSFAFALPDPMTRDTVHAEILRRIQPTIQEAIQ